MSNACALRLRRSIAPFVLLVCVGVAPIAPVVAQGWTSAQNGLLPLIGLDTTPAPADVQQSPQFPRRGPLARLIENPDQTDGTPPYALTDQTGTIQRYVEPVPGIDLAGHVGQIVVVRHDSGPTLLASQLDLPRERLRPLMMDPQPGYGMTPTDWTSPRRPMADVGIRQVQYVDNDDMSVQLLPDDMSPGGSIPMMDDGYSAYPGAMMPGQMYGPGGYPPCGGPCCEQPYCDPMQCGPGMMQPYVGPMVAPYQQFGGYPNYAQCDPQPCPTPVATTAPQGFHVAGDVEFLFYRVHVTDQVVGKLSEKYELSPRFTLDFRNIGPLDGRLRYWNYARDTNVSGAADAHFEWEVFDIETVHYFEGRRSQLALSAGIRFVDIEIVDPNDNEADSYMLGLTMAADGLTPVLRMRNGYCGWVYGGRISILGGDWRSDAGSAFVNGRFRDDNTFVSELYLGAECARCCGRTTVRGRLLWDMQNWRSDALADSSVESISFIGPALQLGADF
jgi:hypothetical protein